MTPAKKQSKPALATKQATSKRSKLSSAAKPTSSKARLKDPAGGLTAAGRQAFAAKDGSHLRPGVLGVADTPEKMKRKGSFLTRHFTHPRGPMIKEGEPTRLALSAHAWGEVVPRTLAAAERLAAKGRKLLDQYKQSKDKPKKAALKNADRKAVATKKAVPSRGQKRATPAARSAAN